MCASGAELGSSVSAISVLECLQPLLLDFRLCIYILLVSVRRLHLKGFIARVQLDGVLHTCCDGQSTL